MKRSLLLALGLSTVAGAAFAGPDCSAMPHKTHMWEVVKTFEENAGTVKLAKVTSGNCYEIYGTQNGQKFEIYYNPETGEEISRNKA